LVKHQLARLCQRFSIQDIEVHFSQKTGNLQGMSHLGNRLWQGFFAGEHLADFFKPLLNQLRFWLKISEWPN